MTQRNLIAVIFFCRIMQTAASHSCAKTARITFLADIENDLTDFRWFYDIFYLQLITKLLQLGEVAVMLTENLCVALPVVTVRLAKM